MDIDNIIGAFFFAERLHALSGEELKETFARLVDFGVNTVLIESEEYRDDVISEAHAAGLAFWGGISCFLAPSDDVFEQSPDLRPILSNGEPRPRMEWYNGLPPTNRDHRRGRVSEMARIVENHDLDGFALDFVRWPLHWEIELRPFYPPPLDSSYDRTTLEMFRDEYDLDLPTNVPAEAATWIMENAAEEWISFKCDVITSFVEESRRKIEESSQKPIPLGLCIVPRFPEWVGQRVEDLSRVTDFMFPMSYHSVLYRNVTWVGRNVAGFVRRSASPVVPIVQIDTDGDALGADLGAPVPDDDFAQLVSDSMAAGARGVISFTGTELLREGRGDALRRGLA